MLAPETEIIIWKDGTELLRKIVPPGEYIIGREPTCDLPLDVELVSRRHALITVNYDHVLVEDLGSSNGTSINGENIIQATRLWPNQKIQIGLATVELRRVKPVHQPAATISPQAAAVRRFLPDEFLHDRKYDIGKMVAQGGMGAILEAKEATTDRHVAMKVMLDGSSPEDLTRFIAEAQVTARLEHPSIVPIYELSVDENGQPFYTMKMVRGITLRKVLDLLAAGVVETTKKYPLSVLLTAFQKVCDAIAFAHSKGVIHRDLKPENIMLDDFGVVLVMDWGLAKVIEKGTVSNGEADQHGVRILPLEAAGATLAGTIMGSPQYMSPEQARGEIDALDARCDIYALGGILYHLLALRPSVTGDDVLNIVGKVAAGQIDPLIGGKNEPHSLVAVVRKAMAFDKAQRYETVGGLQRDISAYQSGFATSAENAGTWKQTSLFIKRNKVFAASAALIILLSIAFTIRLLNKNRIITAERNRANATLTELRSTAPTFEAQSRALLSEGKLDDAVTKIGYAVQLAPDAVDYHVARANLLQSTLRLADAADEYRRILALRPGDGAARTNLELCEALVAEKGARPELPLESQEKLLDALITQRRDLEAAPLSKLLNRDRNTAEATLRARMTAYTSQKGWKDNRIKAFGRTLAVNLDGLQIGELSALRGLPISKLSVSATSVTDLHPIAELPLEELVISDTHVSSLSPLHGMKLHTLGMYNTDVSDLSPLVGMPLTVLEIGGNSKLRDLKPLATLPLEKLGLGGLAAPDISPIRGLPLRELWLSHSQNDLPDSSPIAHSPTLEKIALPSQITDIGFLATLPKLLRVDFFRPGEVVGDPAIPARDFLAMYGPDVPEIKAARAALASIGVKKLPIRAVALNSDKGLFLDLDHVVITDLSCLRGLPITELRLHGAQVADLSPLRGMHLIRLNLNSTKVSDVGILENFPDLDRVTLPKKPLNVERLRSLPKLRYLSERWDFNNARPAQTAEEFWKDFDANKGMAPK